MKLTDDWFLEGVSQERRVLQFALYAMYLANGNSIYGRPLKSGTIEAYLRAAATMIMIHCGRDPRFNSVTDTSYSPRINAVLEELRRVEKMPERMEPYTVAMHETLLKMIEEEGAHPDGLLCAAKNWNACNLSMGGRMQEYAQEDKNKEIKKHAMADNNTPRAFTLRDITLFDARNRKVNIRRFLRNKNLVHRIEMRWSWQKNLDNGQKLSYERNLDYPEFCFVNNMWEILCRYNRLHNINDLDTPVAMFCEKNGKGKKRYLYSSALANLIKKVAIATYNLDPDVDLIKYGTHSLRVGACVALHQAGCSQLQLQFLLRWRSTAFFNYLRKVARLSQVQNAALSLAAGSLNINAIA